MAEIWVVYYQISFQNKKGNISHSEQGIAFSEGVPDEESFKRSIVSRLIKRGDVSFLFDTYGLECKEQDELPRRDAKGSRKKG